MEILHEFISGKMNFRKLILWVFEVFFLVLVASAGVAIVRAAWAISDYVVENPRALINNEH